MRADRVWFEGGNTVGTENMIEHLIEPRITNARFEHFTSHIGQECHKDALVFQGP
jgi:hypothetical protein